MKRFYALALGGLLALCPRPSTAAPLNNYDRLAARLEALDQATSQVASGLRGDKLSPREAVASWSLLRRCLRQLRETLPAADADHPDLQHLMFEDCEAQEARLQGLVRAGEAEMAGGGAQALPLWKAELARLTDCKRAAHRVRQALAQEKRPALKHDAVYQTWPARLDAQAVEVRLMVDRSSHTEDPLLRLEVVDATGKVSYRGPAALRNPLTFGTFGVEDGDLAWVGTVQGHLQVMGCSAHGDVSARWKVFEYGQHQFAPVSLGTLYLRGNIAPWHPKTQNEAYEQLPFVYQVLTVLPDATVVASVQDLKTVHARWATFTWKSDGLHRTRWLAP